VTNIPHFVINQNFIFNTFNFFLRKGFNSIKNVHLQHFVIVSKSIFPNLSNGDAALRGALIGHLVVQYTANIKSLCCQEQYQYPFEDLSFEIESNGMKEHV
jgi:hypothetical protein